MTESICPPKLPGIAISQMGRKTLSLYLLLIAIILPQTKLSAEEPAWPSGWTMPYPAHRVIGPLYNVGFEDLSVFLIETSDGHILVNTGLADSV